MVGRDEGRPKDRPKASGKSDDGIVAKTSNVEADTGELPRQVGSDPEGAKAVWDD